MLSQATFGHEVERYPALPVDGPDTVQASFLCADVAGFTVMTERLGDRRTLSVMRELARCAREQAAACGGRVLDIRGDAFLIHFAESLPALYCALSLQRESQHPRQGAPCVGLRMAIHTGEVLCDGDGYFGRDLIVPYRALTQAGIGGIAVTASAAKGIPAHYLAGGHPLNGFAAKGLLHALDLIVLDPDAQLGRGGFIADGLANPMSQVL